MAALVGVTNSERVRSGGEIDPSRWSVKCAVVSEKRRVFKGRNEKFFKKLLLCRRSTCT